MQSGQVLYVDFDGVLHPECVYWHPKRGAYLHDDYELGGHRLFEHAELLEQLLLPYPAVNIVLSTAWVRRYRFHGTAKRLPPGLRSRCVGATFHTRMDRAIFESTPPGAQVQADVLRRNPTKWLALDDIDEGWSQARQHVILTDDVHGIAKPDVLDELRVALKRFATDKVRREGS